MLLRIRKVRCTDNIALLNICVNREPSLCRQRSFEKSSVFECINSKRRQTKMFCSDPHIRVSNSIFRFFVCLVIKYEHLIFIFFIFVEHFIVWNLYIRKQIEICNEIWMFWRAATHTHIYTGTHAPICPTDKTKQRNVYCLDLNRLVGTEVDSNCNIDFSLLIAERLSHQMAIMKTSFDHKVSKSG